MFPVIPITEYVNIGPAPDIGDIEPLVNNVKNIPGVTVPDTDGFTDVADIVKTVPDVIPLF